MENNKTPSIRFKGFTDPWEQRKFGDTCKINGRIGFRGYTEKDIISKEAGGVLTFSPTNIVENKLTMECKNTYITRDKYEESPEIMVKNGDILFVKTGSTLGKSALVTRLEEDASINPQIVVMRVKEGIEAFMSNILITQGILKQVAAVRIGGAVPTMTETELKNFEYFAPTSDKEKMQIGTIFADIDHLITLHQRKYNKLLNVKKSMLEKMFPKNGSNIPEIRFKGFTDPWEQRKLGDLLASLQNNTLSRADLSSESGVAKNVHYGDVLTKFGEVLDISKEKLPMISDKSVLTKYKASFLQNGDVIVADTAEDSTVGKCSEIAGLNGEVVLSGLHTIPYRPMEKFATGYLGYYLNSGTYHNQLIPLMQGIKVTSISRTAIQDTKIVYPKSIDEQALIGNYFQSLDNLITLHQRELEKLQNIKKSMLEKMFV